jgi:hypothetical protein
VGIRESARRSVFVQSAQRFHLVAQAVQFDQLVVERNV